MSQARMIYIIDDDIIIRRSLSVILQREGYRCRPFADGIDFLDALSYLEPGCVLLDVHMPGMNGLEVQQCLNQIRPELPLLIMTAAGDVPTAVKAIKAGAINFIEKPFSDRVLLDMLEQMSAELERNGERAIRHADATTRMGKLSVREREVAAGLVAGLPNKLIAFRLGLGVRTIETHRANLMRKLHVRSISEIVQIAMDAGLEPLGDALPTTQ